MNINIIVKDVGITGIHKKVEKLKGQKPALVANHIIMMNQNHPNPEMRIKAKIASLYKRLDDWQAEQDCPYVVPPLPKYERVKIPFNKVSVHAFAQQIYSYLAP